MNKDMIDSLEGGEYTDLHTHLGGSVSAQDLWEIAHEQGIRLPIKGYWEFVNLIKGKPTDLFSHEEYLEKFKLTEKIQSSPLAVERSVYSMIANGYIHGNVTTVEVRFNPMLRGSSVYDLDMILTHAIIGMKKACLVYPVKAGIIITTDRGFTERQNIILAEKAAKYSRDGVVGFDVSGKSEKFDIQSVKRSYEIAREAGLGLTIHTGEVTGNEEVMEIIKELRPNRIGHGISVASDDYLMTAIAGIGISLEICPISNIRTCVQNPHDKSGKKKFGNQREIGIAHVFRGTLPKREHGLGEIAEGFAVECVVAVLLKCGRGSSCTRTGED